MNILQKLYDLLNPLPAGYSAAVWHDGHIIGYRPTTGPVEPTELPAPLRDHWGTGVNARSRSAARDVDAPWRPATDTPQGGESDV